jgi:hypothetical protein
MWKVLMDVWYKIWGQKRDIGCGCTDFENVDGCLCPPKSKKKKTKMSGVCSAHRHGEAPNCPTCYPETVFIQKKKVASTRLASDGKPLITRERFEKIEKDVLSLKKKRKPRVKR